MHATRALVRGISDTFQQARLLIPRDQRIDVALARRQHAAYVAALRSAGLEVLELPALHGFPDACFVEDCAIVASGTALVTRPGSPSRIGEEPSVAHALQPWVRVHRTEEPATIDGGDCLRLGTTWFVGRSSRTNAAGAARVAEIFGPLGFRVVEVAVADVLHLKCICSPLDDRRVLVAGGSLSPGTFAGFEVLEVPAEEAFASNVVSVNGVAVVAEGFPATRRALEAAGLRVVPLELSEIRKADGSLTCLSLLV